MAVVDENKTIELLIAGELVALPTDTVYGLSAAFSNIEAIEKIYELKGRSKDKPLAVLVSSIEMLSPLVAEITAAQRLLMERFWPGALTLVFKKSGLVSDKITAGRSTIGVRMPNHSGVLKVMNLLNQPIVATSVNVSGGVSLNDPDEIGRLFPDLPVMVNKQAILGLESSVLDLSGDSPKLLRQGCLSKNEIESILGQKVLL